MLVLSRKKDESIIIGDNIEIVIVDISYDQVKLGIKAPKNVSIHRKEVFDAIQMENIAAAQAGFKDFDNIQELFSNGSKKSEKETKSIRLSKRKKKTDK